MEVGKQTTVKDLGENKLMLYYWVNKRNKMTKLSNKSFAQFAGSIFLIIGIVHGLRLINAWPAMVSNWEVPMWLSWLAVILAFYLAYQGLRLARR